MDREMGGYLAVLTVFLVLWNSLAGESFNNMFVWHFMFVLMIGLIPLSNLVLVYGLSWDTEGQSVTSRALCTPVAIWLGKISYSLYLVHWPVRNLISSFTSKVPVPR